MLCATGLLFFSWASTHTAQELTKGLFTHAVCRSVAEGNTGYIRFYYHRQSLSDSDAFIAFVKKNEGPDILRCTHSASDQDANCETLDDDFKTTGLTGGELTLEIPDVSKDAQGLYVLRVMSPNFLQHRVDCNFTVLDKGDGPSDHNETLIYAVAAAGTICGFLSNFALLVLMRRKRILCWRRQDLHNGEWTGPVNKQRSIGEPETFDEKHVFLELEGTPKSIGESETFGEKHGSIDLEDRLLLSVNTTKLDEKGKLRSSGPGSFLIRESERNPHTYVLAVQVKVRTSHHDR